LYCIAFSDLWADESDPAWWLGFVDVHNTSLYMWVDGSLGTFSNFKYEPSDIDKYLAGDDKDKGYQWTEMDDVDHHNVMCKKPRGRSMKLRHYLITSMFKNFIFSVHSAFLRNLVSYRHGFDKLWNLVHNLF
jgi:hypothetical protein